MTTTPRPRFPLYAQVMAAVALGSVLGALFGDAPVLLGVGTPQLGELGMTVIRLLKLLAVPLILFAIVDAFLRTRIEAKAGARLVGICLANVTVAFAIGLFLMNTLKPGEGMRERLAALVGAPSAGTGSANAGHPTLDPLKNLTSYVPESIVEPFLKNSVITVVLLAVLAGVALRRVKDRQEVEGETGIRVVEQFVSTGYQVLVQMLAWVVHAVPFAVFGVVAHAVGRSGFGAFSALVPFLGVILLGLAVHALVYYPLVAWLAGHKSPRVYLGQGANAILTGISANSSLATVPLTLECLTRMGVSQKSARLAACVGTNLNNDGVALYEAMAALFLAQACGFDLSIGQQLTVVLAAMMAGIGVAGIPEAGLVVLPLVLGAAGLPEAVVAAAIPLILPVDWIIARGRSGVNVMSDMLVAILLDRGVAPEPAPTAAAVPVSVSADCRTD